MTSSIEQYRSREKTINLVTRKTVLNVLQRMTEVRWLAAEKVDTKSKQNEGQSAKSNGEEKRQLSPWLIEEKEKQTGGNL